MEQLFVDADPERMEIGRLLARAGRAVQGCHRRTAAEHGLTPTSLGVLELLADTLPTGTLPTGAVRVSHRELAVALGVAPATLTPVIDALARADAVTRSRDAGDRRVVRVAITATGRERLAGARTAVARTLRERMPPAPPEHEVVIRRYLASVLTVLGGAR